MLAKNKFGWTLLEYLNIDEDEIANYNKEDIGYVDECDLKMVELSCV